MATIDVSKVPSTVTIENTSDRVRSIQFYKTNMYIKLEAGNSVVITVNDSTQLIYFLSLDDGEISVTAEEVTE